MAHDRYLTAYDEGYSAYERGETRADNPHLWYTVEGQAWQFGWDDARKINTYPQPKAN